MIFSTSSSLSAEHFSQPIDPNSVLLFEEFCDSFDLYPEGCELVVTGTVESISNNHSHSDGSSFSKIRLHNPIASFIRLRLVDFWCNPADVEDLHHGQRVTIKGRFFDKKMVFSQYTGLRDCLILEKGDVPTSAAPLPPRLSNQEMEKHHQQFLELRDLDGVTILSDLTHNIRIEFDALTPKVLLRF